MTEQESRKILSRSWKGDIRIQFEGNEEKIITGSGIEPLSALVATVECCFGSSIVIISNLQDPEYTVVSFDEMVSPPLLVVRKK